MYQDLKNVYDDVRVVHKSSFEEGSESPEDDPRPGRLVSARSNENMEKTRATVMQDRRITTRPLAGRLGVGKKRSGKFGNRFAGKEDLFEVCAALLDG